jgi:PPOX class probable F420-dependent enzyme
MTEVIVISIDLSVRQQALLERMRNAVLVTVGLNGAPHVAPVWYFWDGEKMRISAPATTRKVADVRADKRVAVCVDDQVSGEYLTIYGSAVVVDGEPVSELTEPLLLRYLPPDEAAARWARINADNSRVIIVVTPARTAGREHVA